jgi:hypothetical protein
MPYFEVTYADGTVEEIEADECQDNGARYLTFVRFRIPFVWTVYTEIVRRLHRRAVVRIDEAVPAGMAYMADMNHRRGVDSLEEPHLRLT